MSIIIDELKDLILKKDKAEVLSCLEKIQNVVLDDDDLSGEITTPAVLTELHTLLIQHMDVAPKNMRLRNRIPNRKRRAFLFVQAMKNGVTYTV